MSAVGILGMVLGGIALVVLLIGAVMWLARFDDGPPDKGGFDE